MDAQEAPNEVDEVDLDDDGDAVGLVRKQQQEADEDFERELKVGIITYTFMI